MKLLISTGKNASNAAIATLLPSPNPNQMTISGAMATLGRLCSANAYGISSFSIVRLSAISDPRTRPSPVPIANPVAALLSVLQSGR